MSVGKVHAEGGDDKVVASVLRSTVGIPETTGR